jgi:alanine racemase
MRAVCADAAVCAVVKANGYGHGAVTAAREFADAGAAGLAVAIVDEGVELRDAGISAPILLLAETPDDAVQDALISTLTLTVGSIAGARAAAQAAAELGGRHRVHLKVDTGMHRMGVLPHDLAEVVATLKSVPNIQVEGFYTHFPVAESAHAADRSFSASQLALFDGLLSAARRDGLEPRVVHTANSAAALSMPESRRDMARVGLALYGYLPDASLAGALSSRGLELRPAMSLRARVTAVRDLEAGERPSYGRRRALPDAARVATVPFGYADGYPRRLFDAGATVLVHGRPRPLAGVVTMDQLVIDCDGDDVRPGDVVTLLGRDGDAVIDAETWATWSDTITWEVLCGVGARVPRVTVP